MKRAFGDESRVSDEATREAAGVVGAVLFGAASLMELVRMATLRPPWPGFNTRIDWGLGAIAIVLWVASACVLATRSHKHRGVAFAGAFALFAYGLLGLVGRSRFGLVYVAIAVVMPLIERLAFRGRLTFGRRLDEPLPPRSGREIL